MVQPSKIKHASRWLLLHRLPLHHRAPSPASTASASGTARRSTPGTRHRVRPTISCASMIRRTTGQVAATAGRVREPPTYEPTGDLRNPRIRLRSFPTGITRRGSLRVMLQDVAPLWAARRRGARHPMVCQNSPLATSRPPFLPPAHTRSSRTRSRRSRRDSSHFFSCSEGEAPRSKASRYPERNSLLLCEVSLRSTSEAAQPYFAKATQGSPTAFIPAASCGVFGEGE